MDGFRSAEHYEVQNGPGSRGATLYLDPAAVEAVIDPAGSVFGLSTSQISRRIKAAGKMAGLGDGFRPTRPGREWPRT